MPKFVIGVDLGQAFDRTAIALLEIVEPERPALPERAPGVTSAPWLRRAQVLARGQKPQPAAEEPPAPTLLVRYLERYPLWTRYTTIVKEVARMVRDPNLTPNPDLARRVAADPELQELARRDPELAREIEQPALVIDATGVGAGVRDMFFDAGLQPVAVIITGGSGVTAGPGGLHVPKVDLIGALQSTLQAGRLQFAENLAEVDALIQEFTTFQYKFTPSGNVSYGAWRESAHDDLILALGLAVWQAERLRGGRIEFAASPFYDYDDGGPAGGVGSVAPWHIFGG